MKRNPSTNIIFEKEITNKRTNKKKNTKTKDSFARRLLAAYNFDALFAITLISFEFLHVRLFTILNIYARTI